MAAKTFAYTGNVAVVTENVVTLQKVADKRHEGMTQSEMKINTAAGKAEFILATGEMRNLCQH